MVAKTAGRKGRPWRRRREQILAASDICWLCGHPGASEVDHVIPRSHGGSNTDPANLRPAHGSWRKCPICGQACNQRRKRTPRVTTAPAPQYQRW